LVEQEKHFGEAPKWAREARALPGTESQRSQPTRGLSDSVKHLME